MTSRLAAGCMTGTSIDALDVALVEIIGRGDDVAPRFIRGLSVPLGLLAAGLRALAEQRPMAAGEIAELSREFSMLHARALAELRGEDRLDLVGVHGQTVYHKPPVSWQLLTPAVIAHQLGVPVVSDFRAMDLAAGGQGAPITPIADWAFFRRRAPLAIANLGGFCNVTLLSTERRDDIRGRDVVACNQLLDTIARTLLRMPFDPGGSHAMKGAVHDEALVDLEGVLAAQASSRRSLGTGDELGEWVSRWRAHAQPGDLASTACAAIAEQVAAATADVDGPLLLAGGGVKNTALTRAIASSSRARVASIDAFGLPADFREAAAFAVLAALCQDRVPITLPQVTGAANAPVSGTWILP